MKKSIMIMILIFAAFTISFGDQPNVIFTGVYEVNAETFFMELFLVQNGDTINGTYDVPLGSGNLGYINGTVSGRYIEFTFINVMYGEANAYESGSGYLIMNEDNKGFTGIWKSNDESTGKWTGVRIY